MEFTLKNRPKPPLYSFNDMEKWFEGLEKELRAILENPYEKPLLHPRKLIKEILGDSEASSS